MAARLVDPTHSSVVGLTPNVLIISGFPWYTSELAVQRYLTDIYPAAAPLTTRLYTNPINGASRGHCFVEYQLPPLTRSSLIGQGGVGGGNVMTNTSVAAGNYNGLLNDRPNTPAASHLNTSEEDPDARLPPLLRDVKRRIEEQPYECLYLKVHAYVLTSQRWSRAGRLPELPTDPPASRWRGRAAVLVGYGDEGFAVRCGSELGLPNTLTEEGHERLERLRKRLRTSSTRRGAGHLTSE